MEIQIDIQKNTFRSLERQFAEAWNEVEDKERIDKGYRITLNVDEDGFEISDSGNITIYGDAKIVAQEPIYGCVTIKPDADDTVKLAEVVLNRFRKAKALFETLT